MNCSKLQDFITDSVLKMIFYPYKKYIVFKIKSSSEILIYVNETIKYEIFLYVKIHILITCYVGATI